MKICAIICEYNPFHNGHLYHIQTAKKLSNADKIVCVMSGNFVQRGEAAILEKRMRAKHAILAGADAVIELPVIFACSNAELFAKGGIKLINSIPDVTHLCFGVETANATEFLTVAKLLNDEPKEVSDKIKSLVSIGTSYAKARAQTFSDYIQNDLLLKPNNILGVEYTRALLALRSKIEILPLERIGSGYKDSSTKDNFSSATALRLAIMQNDKNTLHSNLPAFVLNDLSKAKQANLAPLIKYAILQKSKEDLARVCDCTEGLENAFKRAAEINVSSLETELTSARYTTARIRRIGLQNLLNIEETLIRSALTAPIYLRLLAIKDNSTELLSALGKSELPLLVKNADAKKLTGIAKEVFEKEEFADRVYAIANDLSPLYHNPLV